MWEFSPNKRSAATLPRGDVIFWAVVPISEVIPSRGVRALEGEGRGSSRLEVIARGQLWRQLASRGIDRGAQRVTTDLFHLSALPVTVNLAAANHGL
jgi:hypothetical protein